jgi:anti-sigma regulatory factor (Ser/Thr protein kinase)
VSIRPPFAESSPHILNTLWTSPGFPLQKRFSSLRRHVSGRAEGSAILVPPMESFLDRLLADGEAARPPARLVHDRPGPTPSAAPDKARAAPGLPEVPLGTEAPRIAIYDALTTPPRVVAVEEHDLPALIASLAEKTYGYCREQGGQVPYTVIQELIENLLHAYFKDVVITILDNGQTIRIADHGPGVDDKDRAFLPGFSTATALQRELIRGVGSGLPVARESLQFLRGVLTVEDNLGGGAVFTIRMPAQAPEQPAPRVTPEVKLSTRQTKVLVLLMELGSAGPTTIARELGVAPATAFRELVILQDMGLIHSLGDGKRALAEDGLHLLESIL